MKNLLLVLILAIFCSCEKDPLLEFKSGPSQEPIQTIIFSDNLIWVYALEEVTNQDIVSRKYQFESQRPLNSDIKIIAESETVTQGKNTKLEQFDIVFHAGESKLEWLFAIRLEDENKTPLVEWNYNFKVQE